MPLQTKEELAAEIETNIESIKKNGEVFSKSHERAHKCEEVFFLCFVY